MNALTKPHACKICDLPGHNAGTCPEGDAAIGHVSRIGVAGARPNNYLKITRWISDGGDRRRPVSLFVLFVTSDEHGRLAAYRDARRFLKVPGWEKATISAFRPCDFPADVETIGQSRITIAEEVAA